MKQIVRFLCSVVFITRKHSSDLVRMSIVLLVATSLVFPLIIEHYSQNQILFWFAADWFDFSDLYWF